MPTPKKAIAKLKFGNVVLCEHVVLGENKKVTMINSYAGDILVAEFPANLLFGFYAEHIAESDYESRNMTIHFFVNRTEHAHLEIVMVGGKVGLPAIIAIPIFPMLIAGAATIEAFASAEGFARTQLLKKSVSLPDDSTSLLQPS